MRVQVCGPEHLSDATGGAKGEGESAAADLRQPIIRYRGQGVWRESCPCTQSRAQAISALALGYEINFNRYFYRYTRPRPLAEVTGGPA